MGMLRRWDTPLNRRRWANFRANRRGWYSLWIFLGLFFFALMAEFVANDRPWFVRYDGRNYFPVLQDHLETEFGGALPLKADYQSAYLRDKIEANGFMIWPLIPHSYESMNRQYEGSFPAPPNAQNWLGTDDAGRDVLARMIYGFRISVLFGVALTLASSVIGIAAGALQGYYGGWVDLGFQRFIEIWSGLPTLYLLIILSSFIAPNVYWLFAIMMLFSWMALVGVVRAEFLRVRNFDYVRAARAMGLPDRTIMARHILPNAMVATLTFMPFILSGSIATLTALDFLGFGLPAGEPSLGELLAQGKNNPQAPWLGLAAFGSVGLILTLLIFIGEAARDAFDPRKTGLTQ